MLCWIQGDIVMVMMKPEAPTGIYKKLHPKKESSFKIIKKISSNACVLNLLSKVGINPTFNIEDLTLYHGITKARHLGIMPLSFLWFHHRTKRLKTSLMISLYQHEVVGTTSSKYNGKEGVYAAWITNMDFQQLNLDLHEKCQAFNSAESSFTKPRRVHASSTPIHGPKVHEPTPRPIEPPWACRRPTNPIGPSPIAE